MKHIFIILTFLLLVGKVSAWTSSNEGVCYTMDTLSLLSDSISYNQVDQKYEIACDIVILENDTLKISPGQYIYFIMVIQPPSIWEYYGIKVFGTFKALGQKSHLIYLGDKEYNITNGNIWCGIQFYNTSTNGESKLKYCNFRGAMNVEGDEWNGNADVGIFCENSSPIIDHCNFCYVISSWETGGASAIACKGQSYPIISYCNFEHLYNSIAIWCNPWYCFDTINVPSPLVYGCNILPSVTGFFFWPIDDDVIIFRGGFIDNCYLGATYYSADTTLGFPIDTIGNGICNTTSTFWEQKFMDVDGVKNPRGDTLLTGIDEEETDILPTTSQYFVLKNNYPNPFSSFTTIEFEVTSQKALISMYIYDSKGNCIKQLINNSKYTSGTHQIKWNADNEYGKKVNPGIYFYKLINNDQLQVKKAIVVKN
ncbi:MAG: T9SS type A sorting domain-containing protein [Bacteroidales bacterium]